MLSLLISLSLFDVYFIYSTHILLSLFDFNFRENRSSCFSKSIYYTLDNLIIVVRKLIYYRYSKFISLSLFDFDFYKNRNSYFVKTFSLCARGFYYYYLMFIMRSIISLSLFDIHFNYSIFILLSLFDFNFRKSLNSCFSHIFIVRSIISLLLFDNHLIYSTLDV